MPSEMRRSVGIHAEDNRVDFVAGLDQLRGMLHALRPGHLGDVNQSFDALLELDERAVVGDRENAAADVCADRIALRGIEPRIRRELLEAERDALLVLVELQHLHLDLVADVDQVARMRQASPAHVGDVQQAVEAAQVDERAVVGQVLDRAGENRALFRGARAWSSAWRSALPRGSPCGETTTLPRFLLSLMTRTSISWPM